MRLLKEMLCVKDIFQMDDKMGVYKNKVAKIINYHTRMSLSWMEINKSPSTTEIT
mgnify:CR=1 FL=1